MPVLLVLGLLTFNQSVDMYVHDTYFVISNLHLAVLFGLTLSLLGLGYWIINKIKGNLIKLLSVIHLTLTIGGILLLMLLVPLTGKETESYIGYHKIDYLFMAAMFSILSSQLIYVLNLIAGGFRRK